MSNQTEISKVTLVNDDDQIQAHRTNKDAESNQDCHIFQYNLNHMKSKKKILEGAMRIPYNREDKKTCAVLTFSDGSFKEVVLKAVFDLKNSPKNFSVGKVNVERVTIDPRKELSGKHVDTKIEFRVDGEKVLIHVYNSKQKLLIQGRKYEWFINEFLEPYFIQRIHNLKSKIETINSISQGLSISRLPRGGGHGDPPPKKSMKELLLNPCG